MTEDNLIEVYGRLSNILHAENPLGKETDCRFFINSVSGLLSETMNLLECHKVYRYRRPEEFHLIKMFGDMDGELMQIRFNANAEGKTRCAWPNCVSSSARQYCEYIQWTWKECTLPKLEQEQTRARWWLASLMKPASNANYAAHMGSPRGPKPSHRHIRVDSGPLAHTVLHDMYNSGFPRRTFVRPNWLQP